MMSSDSSVGFLVNVLAKTLRQMADRRLKPFGLSSGHLPVITALKGNPVMSQKALARFAGVEQPTMAATLIRMERDGIIARRPDPSDGRGSLISLSERLLTQLPKIEEVVLSIDAEAIASIEPAQRELFRPTLVRIIKALDEQSS